MSAVDLSLSFPSRGVIRLQSRALFVDADAPTCRRFLRRVFQASEIIRVTIRGGPAPHADLHFRARTSRPEQVVERIIALLRRGDNEVPSPDLAAPPARRGLRNALGRTWEGEPPGEPRPPRREAQTPGEPLSLTSRAEPRPPGKTPGDSVRHFRRADVATGWTILRDEPGRIRLRNPSLRRRSALARVLERELKGVLGIESYRTRPAAGTIQVDYDPSLIDARDVLTVLDAALQAADVPDGPDPLNLRRPLATAAVPIAAVAQFAAPALLPVAAALFAYNAIPTLRASYRTLTRDRRLGADLLDSAVVLGCLGTMSIFPGAVFCWALDLGRSLVERTNDSARTLLLDGFGKQPPSARVVRDGTTSLQPIRCVSRGDLIVVDAGEVIPADGRIVAGLAMIDPHPLTGGSDPAPIFPGERVLAATLLTGGRVTIAVEAAGPDTAAARIGRLLHAADDGRPSYRENTDRLADRLAAPSLALGALGIAALGPAAGVALLNRDFASGLRMAAPLATLGALALCAHAGILVKDARALQTMGRVDTILLDLSALPRAGHDRILEVAQALRRRGIRHIALTPPADRAAAIAAHQARGRTVCLVGNGVDDPAAMDRVDVSISLRGAASLEHDAAQIVLLDPQLEKLCDLRDIAGDLARNLRRSRSMVVAPNVAAVAGVFTMGLGLMASVAINNLAALAALANAAIPLRKVAQLEAERRHRLQMARLLAAGRSGSEDSGSSVPAGVLSGPSQLASSIPAPYDGGARHVPRDASASGGSGHPAWTSR